MDIRLLEYFVVVADERNVTRAAQRLYAAQSTVSAGLRSLEQELGVALLERTTRSISLTPAGEDLLVSARSIVDEWAGMREAASESTAGIRGRVSMGTFTAMPLMDLPRVLGQFRRDFPLVDVHLTASPSGSTGLVDDVLQGRLDLAFTTVPPPAGLMAHELAQVPYVALVPEGHALAEADEVDLATLAGQPWVDVLPGYGNRVQIDRVLAQRGLSRRVVAEIEAMPSIPEYVAAGLGVALIPEGVQSPGCVTLPITDLSERWILSLVVGASAARRRHVDALRRAIATAPLRLV
ncbi:LysR family transcriptional regulator [Microbacterium gorillae]|uniref:LysR family transcriptional regulator n=1 Tax=Microbacterium gorillae TaxID=1231063 RepID=UPI003D96F499